jgi:signal transduction histidine kinase
VTGLTVRSLRLRLLAAGGLSILLALALGGLGLAILFENHVERRAVAELSVHLDQVIAALDRNGAGDVVLARPPADPRFERPLSGLYWQVESGSDAPEGWLLRSRSLWDARLPLPKDVLADGGVHEHVMTGPTGASLLVLERMVRLPARLGGTRVRTAVALDRRALREATTAFVTQLAPYLGVLALVLIVASALQITVGLRPLAAIQARVGAIRSGDATRLGTEFPSEVRPLAAEVDALLSAREADIARARARAADLAHGLKTPLQVLAGDVERLRTAGETAMAEEIEQVAAAMRRHVERELARARLAAGVTTATCRPAEVVRRVLAVVRRTPDGARLDWHTDMPAGLVAPMDADDLTEVLGALVENAARHATASVTLEGRRTDDGGMDLTVTDDGPGIPADRRAGMLVRGQRLDMESDGSGLGLSIALDILTAWGGSLVLEDAPAGGLRARIRLPGRA